MKDEDFKEVLDLVKSKSPEENDIEYLVRKLNNLNEELLELKGEMTMYTLGGSKEIYPIDSIKFLTKLCNYFMGWGGEGIDMEEMEEIIENYNNHPNKEDLSECIEDITQGEIKWEMLDERTIVGFYNGSDWLFYNKPSPDSSDWC